MQNQQIDRKFLIDLGFTKIINEQVEKHSHWFVAINTELQVKVAVNLSPLVQRTPFTYLTLETAEKGWTERIYRGLVTPTFLYTLLELRKIKK